jgi:hypothetical protein
MIVDDGIARYGLAIIESSPEFTSIYPMAESDFHVEEILAQVELEFLSSR